MRPERMTLFCPVKMACEVLAPRWTIQILAELGWGSSRFNELRRGIPGISPALLTKRLKELQANGLVVRVADPARGTVEYLRTDAAVELEPVIQALGEWAYRNTSMHDTIVEAEPRSFVWHLRLNIDAAHLPDRRVTMQLSFPEQPAKDRDFWIVCKPGQPVEVCYIHPGFDVDLYIHAELAVMVSAVFGYTTLAGEIDRGRISLIGHGALARSIVRWLVPSPFAERRRVAQGARMLRR